MQNKALYAGISNCKLGLDTYELGEGVILSDTFAHLFAPYMVAFAPPGPQGYHPAPWVAAKGGMSFDIHAQLSIPENFTLSYWENARDVAWWIVALMRLAHFPYISIPVVSDAPFSSIPTAKNQATLVPYEFDHRGMVPAEGIVPTLSAQDCFQHLEWVRSIWMQGGELLSKNKLLNTSFRAFDAATFYGRPSSALLLLWGALEQLFAPSNSEISFRVASYIAAYLEPSGPKRLEIRKKVSKLYNARSRAAHTSKAVDQEDLIETWILTRNLLVRIIADNKVPDQAELESLLFDGTDSASNEPSEGSSNLEG